MNYLKLLLKPAAGAGLVVFLASCVATPGVAVTFITEPEGAVIVSEGASTPVGRAPVTRYYGMEELTSYDDNGCLILPGVAAVWESGASANIGGLRVCDLEQKNLTIDLQRPLEVGGYEIDLEMAEKLRQERASELERLNRIPQGGGIPRDTRGSLPPRAN